jgi:hypothetical protein
VIIVYLLIYLLLSWLWWISCARLNDKAYRSSAPWLLLRWRSGRISSSWRGWGIGASGIGRGRGIWIRRRGRPGLLLRDHNYLLWGRRRLTY